VTHSVWRHLASVNVVMATRTTRFYWDSLLPCHYTPPTDTIISFGGYPEVEHTTASRQFLQIPSYSVITRDFVVRTTFRPQFVWMTWPQFIQRKFPNRYGIKSTAYALKNPGNTTVLSEAYANKNAVENLKWNRSSYLQHKSLRQPSIWIVNEGPVYLRISVPWGLCRDTSINL
jgi:hypothetical protein